MPRRKAAAEEPAEQTQPAVGDIVGLVVRTGQGITTKPAIVREVGEDALQLDAFNAAGDLYDWGKPVKSSAVVGMKPGTWRPIGRGQAVQTATAAIELATQRADAEGGGAQEK